MLSYNFIFFYIVAVHERNYLNRSWNIQLKHYLKTLYIKPGTLHKNTAQLQKDTKIQNIFKKYYSKDAKTFLEVLEVIYERGVDDVADTLIKLEKISPLDMSRDKVLAICDHAVQTKYNNKKNYTDALSEKSRTSLSLYNKLANLPLERTV